jgi:hypothetical protein
LGRETDRDVWLLMILTFNVRSAPIGTVMSMAIVAKVPRFVHVGI